MIRPQRGGFALPLVLAALVLAGVLAAGAVMAAIQGMRDAEGAIVRAQATAAAEGAIARALSAAEWDSTWGAGGAPGLVALHAHPGAGPGGAGDTVRIVRLSAESILVIAEGYAGARAESAARARLGLLVVLGVGAHPVPATAHSWSAMP